MTIRLPYDIKKTLKPATSSLSPVVSIHLSVYLRMNVCTETPDSIIHLSTLKKALKIRALNYK